MGSNPKQITEQDWRCIEAFKRRAQELADTKLLSPLLSLNEVKISMKCSFEVGKPVKLQLKLPSERDLKELFLAFRFFYLQKEPSNFLKIINLLSRKSDNEITTQVMREYKKRWKDALFGQTIFVYLNGEKLNAAKILELWFDAHYFHSMENKEKELEILNNACSAEFSKYMLVHSVLVSTTLILTVYESLKTLSRTDKK